MSDEEKKAIEHLKDYLGDLDLAFNGIITTETAKDYKTILNLIEKQSKEIEESEQKEKQAYIDGTNVADKLCNEKWERKIKAKIEELEKLDFGTDLVSQFTANLTTITILQSLLEKE